MHFKVDIYDEISCNTNLIVNGACCNEYISITGSSEIYISIPSWAGFHDTIETVTMLSTNNFKLSR